MLYRVEADRAAGTAPGGARAEETAVRTSAGPEAGETDRMNPAAFRPPIENEGATARREEKAMADGSTSIRYRTAPPQAGLFEEKRAASDGGIEEMDLERLEAAVASCTRCALHETRTKTVFGAGSPTGRIVFIGEAPGRDEDLSGEPFVGRAGKLLDKILASVGFAREDVYIANILKCRPPNNRDPLESEGAACEPYLRRQLELLDPVLVVALGRVAGQNLLKRNASLKALRGGIHYYDDIRVIVTYHPAALLRNPNLKRAAWADIQLVRRIYDEETGA